LSPTVKLQLPFVSSDRPIYRVGRSPDPWRPAGWSAANDDGKFINRFDDSEGYFRVLYAGSTRLCCFIETLARYRNPGPLFLTALETIANSPPDHTPPAIIPASWLDRRRIGRASVPGKRFADIYSSQWLSYLRSQLEPELFNRALAKLSEPEFDLALLMSKRRWLTQRAATLVYRLGYDGIYYQSRYGSDLLNFAIFEPFQLEDCKGSAIAIEDPDFQEALCRLDLRLGYK
jgi:hypothetical protein